MTSYNHVVNVPVVVIPGVGVIYGLELVTVGEINVGSGWFVCCSSVSGGIKAESL